MALAFAVDKSVHFVAPSLLVSLKIAVWMK
jgi:hypothetical protein